MVEVFGGSSENHRTPTGKPEDLTDMQRPTSKDWSIWTVLRDDYWCPHRRSTQRGVMATPEGQSERVRSCPRHFADMSGRLVTTSLVSD